MGSQISTAITYLRETKVLAAPRTKITRWQDTYYVSQYAHTFTQYTIDYCVLGLCGHMWPMIKFMAPSDRIPRWDITQVKQVLNKLPVTGYQNDWSVKWSERKCQQFLASDFSGFEQLFQRYQVPAFLIRPKCNSDDQKLPNLVLELNPTLEELHWQHTWDPWKCFQEISMYVGGILGNNEDKIPPVSEADRLAGHGFDQSSFRRQPATVAKRRKHREKQ